MFLRPCFLLLTALIIGLPAIGAARTLDSCDAESEFDLTLHPNRLELTRDDGKTYPRRVELVDGRLWLDNREQRLAPEDHARLLRFEAEVRALIPQVRAVALQAVGIAVDALRIVIAELGGDNTRLEEIQRGLEEQGRVWEQRIRTAQSTRDWDFEEHGEMVGKLVAQMVPAIAGELASTAVRAALAGDTATLKSIEARTERLEQEIKARIEARADRLEVAAKALCPSVEALDRIDNALTFRLADNRRLELIEVDRD